ncbi:family 1 glycosylhydrolase [uncultured Caulobacter sp.]|uniref:family 1 glycosylhydrolase n=1 Tax=uncultured Caulobacter sp. TaxID=158749 RepID=UPI00261CCCCD|nr:family 1 glycosylhydrolase [uncultured Caulobacter sp.]
MLELWGGHECTVNRVRDDYRDQSVISGHDTRVADLDLFAAAGCRALRYPVLWERVSPRRDDPPDWTWSDERLKRLRALSIRPIVGLCHHGSGPRHTDLLDPEFAPGLAAHAQAVAERYDWIEDWTPVNEPLTTARFSALYGHWHPHAADEGAFWTALLNQIDAVRLSMRAIRRARPDARLIQTEDLGRTYATPPLREQADFENLRRWMTWDLLTGRVDREHGLFERLDLYGLGDRLRAIADAPCPPDVLGVNHYLTSERFLDHRLERYPPERHGGNATVRYADVEAVRVLLPGPDGLEGVLRETHARYGLPMAVTEVHNGCTREEQMRWLLEAWRAAERLRADDIPVIGVTAWSLLGAFDWDSLLTRATGSYEPGVFDLRDGAPRPTGLATLMKALAERADPPPAALGAGWWRRDIRLEYAPVRRPLDDPPPTWLRTPEAGPPLVILGDGTLGQAVAQACLWRGLDYRIVGDRAKAGALIDGERPWAIIAALDAAEARDDLVVRWAAASAIRGLAFLALVGGDSVSEPLVAELLAMDARILIAEFGADVAVAEPEGRARLDQALDLLIDGERGRRLLTRPWVTAE